MSQGAPGRGGSSAPDGAHPRPWLDPAWDPEAGTAAAASVPWEQGVPPWQQDAPEATQNPAPWQQGAPGRQTRPANTVDPARGPAQGQNPARPTRPASPVVSTVGTPPGSGRPPGEPVVAAGPAASALGVLIALLVLAALGTAYVAVTEWLRPYLLGVPTCLDAGGAWECLVHPGLGQRVYLPAAAVLGALALARGAGVERRPRPAIGFVLALAGVALLAIAWTVNR